MQTTKMIPATSLRLHNTVEHDGRKGRVHQLAEDSIILLYENGDVSEPLSEESVDGIRLTAEVLETNGFVYTATSNAYQFVLDEDVVLTVNPHIFGGNSIQLCVKGHWCGRPVQTLHELQNIYLDLTGKELALD